MIRLANGLMGYDAALIDTRPTASSGQRIRDSGRALLALINDILDFSKIEAGRWSWRRSSSTPCSRSRTR